MDSKSPASRLGRAFKPGYMPLQTRLAISFAVLAILTSGFITISLYLNVRQRLLEDIRLRVRDAAAIGAQQVDGDLHATLTEPSQEDGESYMQIKRVLQKIRDAGTNYRFVYTMRYVDGSMVFIVDAETNPEDISHLGDVYYEFDPEVATILSTLKEPFVEEEFYTDRWGTWLTGYAPVFKSNGELDAVIGMDIAAADITAYERQILSNALVVYLLTIPIVAFIGWLLGRRLAVPITSLIESATRIAEGNLEYPVTVRSHDETATLGAAFEGMRNQLRELIQGLERRVSERTQEVEQRSSYLKAAAEVGQAASSILDADVLIQQVVDLIRERFGLYYVGLFMVDEAKEWALLRAGTGEAGVAMLRRGHRIRVGEGMVGWSIANSRARVALQAEQDAVRVVSDLLPNTRSEAALPLRSRGSVFGALTVQSDQPGVFDEETMTVLQTMADQVAVALDNARLFTASEEALKALRRSYGELSREAWSAALRTRATLGYHGDAKGIYPITADEAREAAQTTPAEGSQAQPQPAPMKLPIRVRDQVLGVIEARKPGSTGEWTAEEISLMNTLVDQLSVALENARLYEDTQQRAERERILSDITSKVRASTEVNVILQTAVQELAEALHVPRGSIRLRGADIIQRDTAKSQVPRRPASEDTGDSHE